MVSPFPQYVVPPRIQSGDRYRAGADCVVLRTPDRYAYTSHFQAKPVDLFPYADATSSSGVPIPAWQQGYHIDALELSVVLEAFQFGHDELLVELHLEFACGVVNGVEGGEVVVDGDLTIEGLELHSGGGTLE